MQIFINIYNDYPIYIVVKNTKPNAYLPALYIWNSSKNYKYEYFFVRFTNYQIRTNKLMQCPTEKIFLFLLSFHSLEQRCAIQLILVQNEI